MRKQILSVLFILMLSSCGDPKIVKTEVEIILQSNVVNATEDLKTLTEPLVDKEKSDIVVVSYPLFVNRLDLDVRQKLDYLNNKAVNYEKISPIKRDFKKYFENSFSDSLFSAPSNTKANIDAYLNMDNCFVYSDKAVGEVKLGAKKVYQDVSELKKAIAIAVEKGTKKIFVVFKPDLGGIVNTATSEESKPISQNSTKVVEPAIVNTSKASSPPSSNNGNGIQATANSLDECFQKLADSNIPYSQKSNLLKNVKSYFTSNAKIYSVNNNNDVLFDLGTPADFSESLCTSHRRVYIKGNEAEGSKIAVLKVQVQ